jgi:hypothetical protein
MRAETGSLGKGMPMFTLNNLVIGKQPENPENPLFYFTGGILNPEEPRNLWITLYRTLLPQNSKGEAICSKFRVLYSLRHLRNAERCEAHFGFGVKR